jgi:hypothetical protein
MFVDGAMRRGLEVGGRWERIGVESAHELIWNAEVEAVVALNITRIAQIVRVVDQKERNKRKERKEDFWNPSTCFFLKEDGLTSKVEGADRGSGWVGNTRQKDKGGFYSLQGCDRR